MRNITRDERIKIQALYDQGYLAPQIANYLGRNKTTIYRELSKKQDNGKYDYEYADKLSSHNMARHRHQGPCEDTVMLIEEKLLSQQWSPEQISGWLSLNKGISISHTWIYKYVEKDAQQGGELANHMRRGKYNFEPREYKGKIKNRTTIEERPSVINERKRLGDFEADLIVGPKNKGAILTIIDRLSRYCLIRKLEGKGSKVVKTALIEALEAYNSQKHSITTDNGNEFMLHEEIAEALNINYYFAHPYASYERGSIENLNGLIRQYIPKGTQVDEVSHETIKIIQEKLNTRPRKILNYLTPEEYHVKMNSVITHELRL